MTIFLKTGKLQLNDSTELLLVSEFESKELALFYFDSILAEQVASANLPNVKIHKFVITEDNFNSFYDSRELDAYLIFFESNY